MLPAKEQEQEETVDSCVPERVYWQSGGITWSGTSSTSPSALRLQRQDKPGENQAVISEDE